MQEVNRPRYFLRVLTLHNMKEKNLFAVELHLSRTSLNVASPLGIFKLIFAVSLRAMLLSFFRRNSKHC